MFFLKQDEKMSENLKDSFSNFEDEEAFHVVSDEYYRQGFLLEHNGVISCTTSDLKVSFNKGSGVEIVCPSDFEDGFNRRVLNVFVGISGRINESKQVASCGELDVRGDKVSVTLKKLEV